MKQTKKRGKLKSNKEMKMKMAVIDSPLAFTGMAQNRIQRNCELNNRVIISWLCMPLMSIFCAKYTKAAKIFSRRPHITTIVSD